MGLSSFPLSHYLCLDGREDTDSWIIKSLQPGRLLADPNGWWQQWEVDFDG